MNMPDSQAITRARIADAAEGLFRRLGYQKTAVADIARECGMSPANVYRFFPSKSAINEAIAQRLLTGIEAEVRDLAAGPGTAEARIRAILRLLHVRDRDLFISEQRLHDMVAAAMAEHWGVIERFVETVRTVLAGLLAEGMEAGHFRRRDPARTAVALNHCTMIWMHPLLIADCLSHGEAPSAMEQELEEAMDLLMDALRVPE
ncbi:TetR/AcrR family transcriptional regulator [Roseococcus thiosulfatophilus]|uniref:TetR/AcrR family transcriptional regulator n=1 Tax=Roseococcus thiosulfatophilus TaxID=35813 RepID=UPI001A8F8321|nr:TetR family transcriptional regulator [Roseococcus thiosulfatophilus]